MSFGLEPMRDCVSLILTLFGATVTPSVIFFLATASIPLGALH